ncbi:hypothetical protein AKJ09_00970 [Labilithrix luteola]|uniref:Uncharacterized protein n=2 Tax=Labilithrix luteola TaxID=1391654 RepID=A0A0K1PLN7_9BACT|nr:hypothetical protein AKJ09_00970 [Labilithrix luteola]
MDVLASVPVPPSMRALLVAYPPDPCASTASVVLLDGRGRFIGAVAPGTATLLAVPALTRTLHAISSDELTAPVGSSVVRDVVVVPPSPSGLLVSATRFSPSVCGNGRPQLESATKEQLEWKLVDVAFIEPRPGAGEAWLAAHRARVDEILHRRSEMAVDVAWSGGPL